MAINHFDTALDLLNTLTAINSCAPNSDCPYKLSHRRLLAFKFLAEVTPALDTLN